MESGRPRLRKAKPVVSGVKAKEFSLIMITLIDQKAG